MVSHLPRQITAPNHWYLVFHQEIWENYWLELWLPSIGSLAKQWIGKHWQTGTAPSENALKKLSRMRRRFGRGVLVLSVDMYR